MCLFLEHRKALGEEEEEAAAPKEKKEKHSKSNVPVCSLVAVNPCSLVFREGTTCWGRGGGGGCGSQEALQE